MVKKFNSNQNVKGSKKENTINLTKKTNRVMHKNKSKLKMKIKDRLTKSISKRLNILRRILIKHYLKKMKI